MVVVVVVVDGAVVVVVVVVVVGMVVEVVLDDCRAKFNSFLSPLPVTKWCPKT